MLPPRKLTMSQVNELGHRLRRSEFASESDLTLLQQLLEDHAYVLAAVQERLLSAVPDITATPRLKTVPTIVEKLKREKTMALSRMRDIAGIRIVEDMSRREQDVLRDQVVDAVGGGRVIDRRTTPKHGYRAVHVEARFEGRSVEIQIRTRGQDQWAQIVEKLGDAWGRQIRYGELPRDPDQVIVAKLTRREVWRIVLDLSNALDAVEQEEVDAIDRSLSAEEVALLANRKDELHDLLASLASAFASPERL